MFRFFFVLVKPRPVNETCVCTCRLFLVANVKHCVNLKLFEKKEIRQQNKVHRNGNVFYTKKL